MFAVWTLCSTGLDADVADFVASSLQSSSCRTYKSAWLSWSQWCTSHSVDPTVLSETNLVSYLFSLFHLHGLSPATLGVRRAAVSSFLAPLEAHVSESPLLHRFMRAAVLERPLAHSQPRFTWDVVTVLSFLKSWGELASLSFTNYLTDVSHCFFCSRAVASAICFASRLRAP